MPSLIAHCKQSVVVLVVSLFLLGCAVPSPVGSTVAIKVKVKKTMICQSTAHPKQENRLDCVSCPCLGCCIFGTPRNWKRKGNIMQKYPQNQSYVGSSGQTLTTDVSSLHPTTQEHMELQLNHHFEAHIDPSCSLPTATNHVLCWIGTAKAMVEKKSHRVTVFGQPRVWTRGP